MSIKKIAEDISSLTRVASWKHKDVKSAIDSIDRVTSGLDGIKSMLSDEYEFVADEEGYATGDLDHISEDDLKILKEWIRIHQKDYNHMISKLEKLIR